MNSTQASTSTTRRSLAPAALGLGLASVALITVVAFIAMALGLAAIVVGVASSARSSRGRVVALLGAIAGAGSILFFILHVM
ncbi:MAG TPA: hypothetical protein VMZ33_07715 [Candidatus Limnocylindrales bacterium]|nr:hypothetical protein [Candidatus Limnocylindrales bacterium]